MNTLDNIDFEGLLSEEETEKIPHWDKQKICFRKRDDVNSNQNMQQKNLYSCHASCLLFFMNQSFVQKCDMKISSKSATYVQRNFSPKHNTQNSK